MDERTDRFRDHITGHRIPWEFFNGIIKIVVVSDTSDARQKIKPAGVGDVLEAHTITVASEMSV